MQRRLKLILTDMDKGLYV